MKQATKQATRTLTLDAELVEAIEECAHIEKRTVPAFLAHAVFDLLEQLHTDAGIEAGGAKHRVLARKG